MRSKVSLGYNESTENKSSKWNKKSWSSHTLSTYLESLCEAWTVFLWFRLYCMPRAFLFDCILHKVWGYCLDIKKGYWAVWMCGFTKYPCSPYKRSLEISRGRSQGSQKWNFWKKTMKLSPASSCGSLGQHVQTCLGPFYLPLKSICPIGSTKTGDPSLS